MSRRTAILALVVVGLVVGALLLVEVQRNSDNIYATAMQRYEYGNQTAYAPLTQTADAP